MYLVRENINDKIKQEFNTTLLNESINFQLHALLEKAIRTDSKLLSKLNSIRVSNSDIVQDLRDFLESRDIRDNANIEELVYDIDNPSLLNLEYVDKTGNKKITKQKFTRALDYLGFDLSKYTPREIQDLVNFFKKGELDNFKLLAGEEIRWGYHMDNYDYSKDVTNERMGSCMAWPSCQGYFDIYVRNPGQVRLLVLMNPETEKVRGRALVWTLSNGSKLMDRIYYIDSAETYLFNFYAEKHGISQSIGNAFVQLEDGGYFDYYPYMDTFDVYVPDLSKLYNYTPDTGYEIYNLTETDGRYEGGEPTVYSEYYGEEIPEGNAVWIEHLDSFIYRGDEVWSRYHGEDISEEHAIRVTAGSRYDEWFLESDLDKEIIVTLRNGDIAFGDDVVCDYNGDWYLDEDCTLLTTGDYEDDYANDNEVQKTYDDEYALDSECVELTYGEYEGEYALEKDTVIDYAEHIILRSESMDITHGSLKGQFAWEDDPNMVVSDGRIFHINDEENSEDDNEDDNDQN